MRFLTPFSKFEDERGTLLGVTKGKTWEELNYLESKAGAVRGNHYHKEIHEMVFFIDGKVELKIHNIKTSQEETAELKPGDIIVIEPYEVHTFEALSDSKWVNMLSIVYDPENPDVFKSELT